MTYETIDGSVSDGSPEELYVFRVENLIYLYTSAPYDIKIGVDLYRSKQIARTALVNNMSIIDNSDTKITLPRSDLLSIKCAGLYTPTIINVDIYQRHRTDPDAQLKRIFSGYLLDIGTNSRETEFSFTSLMRAYVEASVATVVYTTVCNHDWGDNRCRVNVEEYAAPSQIIAVDLWTLVIADYAGVNMSKYVGGYVVNQRTEVRRNIVNINNNHIFVDGMFSDVEIGDAVKLYPGCDHDLEGDCFRTYNNVLNFGGFPFVPRSNPFRVSFGELNYYNTGAEE